MRQHENIVKLVGVYSAENKKDLYLTFEYMPTDLHVVIRSNILNEVHMQYITYQMLRALKYTHSAKIIHRDIKPSNILMDQNCHVKICDFGLCRSVEESEGKHLTDYVATRWYRPPEVLLCSKSYTEGIDVWAVACILGEMLRNIPLLPGA
jgi:mitogen-activated protein kinase 15